MKNFSQDGYCPICEADVTFTAESETDIPQKWQGHWFRDKLKCSGCNSPPRERILAHFLEKFRPEWRGLAIHEGSPGGWALSGKLRTQCEFYTPTQYDPTAPFGTISQAGWRNENLENQTFEDDSFDVVITQDVFEHLFNPGLAASEIARTLRPGGICLMTVPVMNPFGEIERRAAIEGGRIVHLLPEKYHGNPVGDGRSLVTVDWSYGIGAHLSQQSGIPFSVLVLDDMQIGARDAVNAVLAGINHPISSGSV
jgi:SAM-dependent methyltransferase